MGSVVVEIRDSESGRVSAFAFERFPIRVGRNELNDLVLAFPFVSEFHGVLRRRQEGATFFVDLGATNPTCIDGNPVERHHPVPVAAGARVQIGTLELALRADGAAAQGNRGRTALPVIVASGDERAVFAAMGADGATKAGQTTLVLPLKAEPSGAPPAVPTSPPEATTPNQGDILRELTEASRRMNPPAAVAAASPLPTAAPSPVASHRAQPTVVLPLDAEAVGPPPAAPSPTPVVAVASDHADILSDLTQAARRADAGPVPVTSPLPAAAPAPIVADGSPPDRTMTGARSPGMAPPGVIAGGTRLIDRPSSNPRPAQPAVAGGTKVLDAGGEDLRRKLAVLLQAQPGPIERGMLLALIKAAYAALGSIVALRNGLKAQGEEIGIDIAPGRTSAHTASSATELLAHFLATDGAAAAGELSELCADLVIHHVAFVRALECGVESLIDGVDPQGSAFEQRTQSRSWFQPMGGLKAYSEFFRDATLDPSSKVLGPAFRDAYVAYTLANDPAAGETGDPPPAEDSGRSSEVRQAPATARPEPKGTLVLPREARLVIVSEPQSGREFPLVEDEATIGRGADNTIVLVDHSVSRHHAKVRRSTSGWIIIDYEGKNGLWVNGTQCKSADLSSGDIVELGATKLRFESIGP